MYRKKAQNIQRYSGARRNTSSHGKNFFRLEVYERIEISLVEACERVRKSVISVGKKAGLTDQFYDCEKFEKTFWFCDLCPPPPCIYPIAGIK